jgi:predicted Zn-dependent protease
MNDRTGGLRVRQRRVKPILVGVVLLGVGIGAALTVREWPVWQVSRAVRSEMAAGRFEAARKDVGRWLELRPDSSEALYYRVRIALALGQRRELAEGAERLKALGLAEPEKSLLAALIDAKFGRPAQATPALRRAFDADRGPDPQVDEALARVYLEAYDLPNAELAIARWMRDAPSAAEPYVWRAEVHRRLAAEPVEVVADYREALARDPEKPEARLGLADELGRMHFNAEAATEYDAYRKLKPDDPAGLLGAGRNALELGDLDAASQRLTRALELAPDNADIHRELAKLAQRRGDDIATLKHLDAVIERKPYDPAVRYTRKLVLVRLKRIDDANAEQLAIDRLNADLDHMNDIQTRLADAPHDARLQSALAHWMFAHGYDQEGINWAKKILIETPGHPETCALLARYYDSQGQRDLASEYRNQIGRTRR